MSHRLPEISKSFLEDGFVIVAGLLPERDLRMLAERMNEITRDPDGLPPDLREKIFLEWQHVANSPEWYEGIITPEDCGNAVRQIADLPLFDTAFSELLESGNLSSIVTALFNGKKPVFQSMTGRPKAARVGNGVRNGNFHRDTPSDPCETELSLIALLCLDDIGAENGATEFIRGSHRISYEDAKRRCWNEVAPERVDMRNRVIANCPAGSGIFFDTRILHAAGHNRSDRSRRTILCEWYAPLPSN